MLHIVRRAFSIKPAHNKEENASQNAGTPKIASTKKLCLDKEVMASPSSQEHCVYNSDIAVSYRINIHISVIREILPVNRSYVIVQFTVRYFQYGYLNQ